MGTTTVLERETSNCIKPFDYKALTKSDFKHIQACMYNMARCSMYTKISMILKKDRTESIDNLSSAAIMKAYDVCKRKNLSFDSLPQFTSFVLKSYDYHIKRVLRDLTQVKSRTAAIIGFDDPVSNTDDSNRVTQGDLYASKHSTQYSDWFYDTDTSDLKDYYIHFSANFCKKSNLFWSDKTSDIYILKTHLKPYTKAYRLLDFLEDVATLGSRELVRKYKAMDTHLTRKYVDKVLLEVQEFYGIQV